MSERRSPIYATVADVAADVRNLRRGHRRTGQWSLAQACHHLNLTTRAMLAPVPDPVPPNTPEQEAAASMLDGVLASGRLPSGIQGPPHTMPPADVPDAAIDEFLATLDAFDRRAGEFPPHRLFGNIGREKTRRLVLIHAAHHLSHLVPAEPATPASAR